MIEERLSDEDIPLETRRDLMRCATSNDRISYYYLCDVWRRGRLSGEAQLTRVTAERDKAYGYLSRLFSQMRFVIEGSDISYSQLSEWKDRLDALASPRQQEQEHKDKEADHARMDSQT